MKRVILCVGMVSVLFVSLRCAEPPGSPAPDDPPSPSVPTLNCSFPTDGRSGSWVKVGGPSGGLGYNVRYNPSSPSTLFVTDAWSGIHKSTDGGQTWQPGNVGITERSGASQDAIPVFSLKIDPNNADRVWAGLQFGLGLFRSSDAGGTFEKKVTGITLKPDADPDVEGISIRHIEVQPGAPNTIYVMGEIPTALKGFEFNQTKGFVYKSTDGGESFSKVNQGNDFNSLTRWLFFTDGADRNELLLTTGIFDREAYAGVADPPNAAQGLGVFRSTDGGDTWVQSNTGISGKSLYVGGADQHPSNPAVLVIATGNNADGESNDTWGGVFMTTDGGQSWSNITPRNSTNNSEYEEIFSAVAFSPSNPTILYAGSDQAVYRSTDTGVTWSRYSGSTGINWGPPGVVAGFPIDMVVHKTEPNTLFINNYGGGVFKSDDGGQSWVNWSKGYTGADVISLSLSESGCLSANGRSGVFRSEDSGANWTGMANDLAAYNEGFGSAYDPSDSSGRTLIVSDQFEGRVLRSTDAGQSWIAGVGLPAGLGSVGNRHGVLPIVFAPSSSQKVYAGFMAAGFRLNPHSVADVSLSRGVYVSNDGGKNWSESNAGLPSGVGDRNVTGLGVSHQDPSKVYAVFLKGGVYRSTNGGSTWTDIKGTLPLGESWNDVFDPTGAPIPRHSILSVAIDPQNDDIVYIGTNAHGVYRTADGGATWEKILSPATMYQAPSPAFTDHAHAMSVVVDPSNPLRIYVADWHSGVHSVVNNGSGVWTHTYLSTGLSTRAVNWLVISENGEFLYAATQGGGVFRYSTGARPKHSLLPAVLKQMGALLQGVPNLLWSAS